MDAWDDHMIARLKVEGYLQKFPDQSSTKTDFENAEIWIKDVTLKTLEFFKARPHLKFIDVCIENIKTPQLLADFFKVPRIDLEHDNAGHYDVNDGKTAAPTPTYLDADNWLNSLINDNSSSTTHHPKKHRHK